MKKLAVFGAVLLVVVGLATSPALAATGSAQDALVLSAGDQAFLATLAVPEVTPAPELTAKRPNRINRRLRMGEATASVPPPFADSAPENSR